MGWNTGWRIMQEQVIGLYDALGEKFTPEVCKVIMKSFIGTDFDEGGKDYNLLSKDGKTEEQIVVETMKPNFDPDSYESEWLDHYEGISEDEKRHQAYAGMFDDMCRDQKLWDKG